MSLYIFRFIEFCFWHFGFLSYIQFFFFAYLIFSFLKGKLAFSLLIGRNIEEKGKQRYEKQKFERENSITT